MPQPRAGALRFSWGSSPSENASGRLIIQKTRWPRFRASRFGYNAVARCSGCRTLRCSKGTLMSIRFCIALLLTTAALVLTEHPHSALVQPAVIKMHLRPEQRVASGVFSLKAMGQPIRVLAFGDFGDGGPGQREAAAAMRRYHKQHP